MTAHVSSSTVATSGAIAQPPAEGPLNISLLAAGAGGMYCGSCMRDNALAGTLRRMGHSVTLIPLYTPLRSDQGNASNTEIFYGGVNVYLQHASRLFRHTPRVLDWIFDRPWLLNAAGKLGAQTPPEKLAGLTLTVIEAEEGSASKELDRLVAFLRDHIKPAVVMLPNLMFVGMARAFRDRLGVPVVCEMTGEDVFLDAMREPDRSRIQRVIRSRSVDVSRFVATSDHYARRMAEYLGINVAEIDVVPTGIATDFFTTDNSAKKTQLAASQSEQAARPPTIGYLARICPEKGLANLLDALAVLRARQGMETVRVQAAGYLGGKDQKWFDALMKRAAAMGLAKAFEYLGEVDRTQKFAFLDSIDVFSVPTAYPEAKGVYLLEAMARGVPVVQPAMGSFPELIEQTGGGLLVAPNDPAALADGLQRLLQDRAERDRLGAAGRSAVQAGFTEEHMAGNMLKVFRSVL